MRSTPKRALLVIDMTNDFLVKKYNPDLALEAGLALVPRIRTLQDAFLDAGLPVIYSTDRHLPDDFELKKWGPHSMKGSEGSQIVEGLRTERVHTFEREWTPEAVDRADGSHLLWEIEKGTYSTFTDNGGRPTATEALLEKLGFGPGDWLYITGLHTNCCDKHTAADAFFRGYVPVLIRDAVAAFEDPEGIMGMSHDDALNYEKFWYDAEILTLDEALKDLA
ncbi:MAG: cysteine hydrolase family protein [Thermoplasmata archaeon]